MGVAIDMSTLISSTGRKVVVGLGATGLSTARFLAARGEEFVLVDTRAQPPALDALRAELPAAPVFTGSIPQAVLDTARELIVSPGVAVHEPWLRGALEAGAALRGDIDLFVSAARAPVIGITGSNAKSTVTELVGAMARRAGRRVAVGGNLGPPALDVLDDRVELYVLELSSFQLERAGELGLSVASVLNLTPDHLDRHGSLERYHQAKHRIFAGAASVVCNTDDPLTIPPAATARQRIGWRLREPELDGFGLCEANGELSLARGFKALLPVCELASSARHDLANALAALALGTAAGLPEPAMLEALRAFTGLPHRCELIAERDGVRWIDDSKASNVGAALAAIQGLGESGRIVLIAGGRNKGADFAVLRPAVAKYCEQVLLIGESAAPLREALEGAAAVEDVGELTPAVEAAARMARPGQIVLLSPACASFDQFASYAARGAAFRAALRRVLAP